MSAKKWFSQLVSTVYDDGSLMAVEKPYGIDVGGRPDLRTVGLLELMAAHGPSGEWQPINRLAHYESGILLLTRDERLHERLRGLWRGGRVTQTYTAVVLGKPTRKKTTLQSAPSVSKDDPRGRKRGGSGKSGGPAVRTDTRRRSDEVTTVTLLSQAAKRSLVRCRTNVPSTHALRAQLRGASMRLQGDMLNDRMAKVDRAPRTCLHLGKLEFNHPVTNAPVVIVCKVPDAVSKAVEHGFDTDRPLEAALVRRLPCLVDSGSDCYRVIVGDQEGIKGMAIDRFGPAAVLEVRDESMLREERLQQVTRWVRARLAIKRIYLRTAIPGQVASNSLIYGNEPEGPMTVRERGVLYEIDPSEPNAPGLFLDQRENRSRVRRMAEGGDVLNLFAYTCGFSVAAALGGARLTVNVDLSTRHLDWGKRNFALNGLDAGQHEFSRTDAGSFVRTAAKLGREFDLIVLDAPTFAHGRKRGQSFSFARDMPDLLRECARLLRSGGSILVGTNQRKLATAEFRKLVKAGLRDRKLRSLEPCPLPPDFAMDPAHARTVLATVE